MYEVGRRGLMQGVLLLAGVAATPAGARALFAGPESLPRATLALVTAVADTIIPPTDTPGAAGAGVPAMFDKLIANWASPAQRTQLLGALEAIDVAADGFVALSPASRFGMLDAYDKGSARPPVAAQLKDEQDKGGAGSPGYVKMKETQDRAAARMSGYVKLKDLIVTLYYLSEVGATEELRYEHSPGAWEPSLPVTAATRAEGGPVGF